MTTFTTSEIATRMLRDLGLLDIEETPSAAMLSNAEQTVRSEVMLMAASGIPIWNGSEISVPEEYLTALSRRLGLAEAPGYGLVDLATATLALESAEIPLKRLGLTPPTGASQEAEYF